MSIEFFKLPAALKKAIWAAYLAEWKRSRQQKSPPPTKAGDRLAR